MGRALEEWIRTFAVLTTNLWPISTRVNKPGNEDPAVIER